MSRPAKHARPPDTGRTARSAAVIASAAALASMMMPGQVSAQASPLDPGALALDWAEVHETGATYSYGATGPYAYDCSGVVYEAFLHATGIDISRDTLSMLASWGNGHFRQVPLSEIRRGDLLFFGAGHVMFATVWDDTAFGALDYGARIGWHRWYPGSWYPTMAFRVEG